MPRKNSRRKAAPVAVEPIAFSPAEVAPKVKNFWRELGVIWASIAGRLSVSYGLAEVIDNLKRFNVTGSFAIRPFSQYGRIHVDVGCLLFGFGGSFNVTLLSDGYVVSSVAEVCTPIVEVAAYGALNDPATVAYIRRARMAVAEAQAEAAAAQAKLDARNAKRRATRAKNARRRR